MTNAARFSRKQIQEELRVAKRKNFQENLKFVRFYTAWMKSKTNKEWSRAQKKLIEAFYRPAHRKAT